MPTQGCVNEFIRQRAGAKASSFLLRHAISASDTHVKWFTLCLSGVQIQCLEFGYVSVMTFVSDSTSRSKHGYIA